MYMHKFCADVLCRRVVQRIIRPGDCVLRLLRDGRSPMTARPARRLLAHGWLYVPAASSPIGGGLIKLGQGSTWAAVAVGMAPYAVCTLLFTVFVIGYLTALIRFCAKPEQQEVME